MDVRAFVAATQKSYGVELPARYRRFLEKREYDSLGNLKLVDGFVRGTFAVDFLDKALTDTSELGEQQCIDDMDDVDWKGEYGDFVPFATLTDVTADEDDEPMKSFLIVSVKDAACPVLVWDYDGWTIYPLAKSIDDFLAGVANPPKSKHDRAATPYKKFTWVEAEDSDKSDDDEEEDED
jgi:hypothetical protein